MNTLHGTGSGSRYPLLLRLFSNTTSIAEEKSIHVAAFCSHNLSVCGKSFSSICALDGLAEPTERRLTCNPLSASVAVPCCALSPAQVETFASLGQWCIGTGVSVPPFRNRKCNGCGIFLPGTTYLLMALQHC